MFILKSKLTSIFYKTIEETARACGRNLSERQKKEIFYKIYKAVNDGKHKRKRN